MAYNIVLGLAVIALCYIFVNISRSYWRLKHVPGSLPASITDLVRTSWVITGQVHLIHRDQHRKHGDVVRFGPNMVSFSDPSVIPAIYPMRKGMIKSPMYSAFSPYANGRSMPTMVGVPDEELHKILKNPIAPLYSLSHVQTSEPGWNRTLNTLFSRLDEQFTDKQQTCDLGKWFPMYTYDSIAEMLFSRQYGLLDQGADIDGLMTNVGANLKRFATVCQMPWADKYLYKNRIAAWFQKTSEAALLKFVRERVQERSIENAAVSEEVKRDSNDFLGQFLKAQEADPRVPKWALMAWTYANVTAGSDSSSLVARALMYNLLANPKTLEKLRKELESKGVSRIAQWRDIRELPYLDACFKEAVRLHPSFALPLERVVPQGGMQLGNVWLPEGTCVGLNPWVSNRHAPTFGSDAESWNPDRWIECSKERRRIMEASILSFGAGKRVCIGIHVATMLVKKLIASMVVNYDVELEDPESFRETCHWSLVSTGLTVKINSRRQTEKQ